MEVVIGGLKRGPSAEREVVTSLFASRRVPLCPPAPNPGFQRFYPLSHTTWRISSISRHGNKLLLRQVLPKRLQQNSNPIGCSHGLRNSKASSNPGIIVSGLRIVKHSRDL